MELSNVAGALSVGNMALNFVANADKQRHEARTAVVNGAIDRFQQAIRLVDNAMHDVLTGRPSDWREVLRQVQVQYTEARGLLKHAGLEHLLPEDGVSTLGQFNPPPLGPAFSPGPPSGGATTAQMPQGFIPKMPPPTVQFDMATVGRIYARVKAKLFGHLQTLMLARDQLRSVKVPTAGLGALMEPGQPDPNLLYSRLFWLALIGVAGYHGYKRNDDSWQKAALWGLPGLLGGTRLAGVVAFVALYQGLGKSKSKPNTESSP